MVKIWNILDYDRACADELQHELNLSVSTCAILLQRGINTLSEAEKFLWPKLAYLRDSSELKNVDLAVSKIVHALTNESDIAIIGDYDVDGITSITLLIDVLKIFGANARFYVPRRFTEGYGLSTEIVARVLTDGVPGLVIALDCGTNSINEVALLKSKGCEVVIVDHHKSKDEACADCCLINPHIYEDERSCSQRIFCTVGLTFKLCHGLLKFFRRKGDSRALNFHLRDELDLVALGTIADLVPLIGENRIFCRYGLRRLSSNKKRAGLAALCRVSGLGDGIPIYPSDVAFKLGPRLNACGRLSDAVLPINMLLSADYDEALTYAYELDETNRERQNLEKEVTIEAETIVKKLYIDDPAIVLFNENWHSGVVGIISGKLARDYNRPCIVLGYERGVAKGSGRSTTSINLVEVCTNCADLLEAWGGHPLAVGVSLKVENIAQFRKKFYQNVAALTKHADPVEVIDLVAEINVDDINDNFMRDLELLNPFGQGNPEPIFLIRSVKIHDMPELFGTSRNHIKFSLYNHHSERLLVLGWEMSANIPPIEVGVDLAVTISMDYWNNKKFRRLTLVDWRVSQI